MMIGVFAAAASAATPRLRAGLPRVVCTASSRAPKRVVFLGTPPVAARSLELLLAKSRSGGADFEVAAVVSQPPSRSGRKMKLTPSPVASLAEAEGLRLLTPPSAKDEGFLQELAALRPDLCVTAAYGCFLPQRFLDIPERGTLNIHPSLLPLYRGAAPVQRCLEAGDAVTGVSVAFTVLAMDSGPILRQVRRPLGGDEQQPELLHELFELGTEQLVEALPEVWDGSALLKPQDEAMATKAPKLDASEAQLDLSTLSARTAHNRVRGFAGGPSCWLLLSLGDGGPPVRAKLLRTALPDQPDQPGASNEAEVEAVPTGAAPPSRAIRLVRGKALQLTCADGSALEVLRLTLPGKKPVDAKSFWNGLNGRTAEWVGRKD